MSSTIDSNCVLNLSTWTNVDEIEYTLFELLIIVIWVASTINDNTVRIITNSLAEAIFYFIFIVILLFFFDLKHSSNPLLMDA
jgi:hypothetical protein